MCHKGRLVYTGAMVTFMLLASARTSSADPFAIPRSGFLGSEQIVEFNVSVGGSLPYSENGATFTSTRDGFVDEFFQALRLQQDNNIGGPSILTVALSDSVSIAGFDLRGSAGTPSIEVELFADLAGLQSLGRIGFGTLARDATAFIGFGARTAFTRADITFTTDSGGSWYIDDFRFDNASPTPEPGTVSLTLLGIAVLGSRIRRKMRRANAAHTQV